MEIDLPLCNHVSNWLLWRSSSHYWTVLRYGVLSGLSYFAIVYEIGKVGLQAAEAAGGAILSAHKTLLVVFIGWAIYPMGYMAGTEGWYSGIFGGLPMDVIYNVGDAICRSGLGLVVYNLAVSSK